MSRRGNCHDNAVAESFFQLLKRERIQKKIYTTSSEARTDIFEYTEIFYNSKRRHGSNGQRSPLEYEKAYFNRAMLSKFLVAIQWIQQHKLDHLEKAVKVRQLVLRES